MQGRPKASHRFSRRKRLESPTDSALHIALLPAYSKAVQIPYKRKMYNLLNQTVMKPLFDENWLISMSTEEVQLLRVAVSRVLDLFADLPESEIFKKNEQLYMDLTHILELRPW